MKLRILGDSVRLRLAQKEVAGLLETGTCEDVVHFGPGQALTYRLVADAQTDVPRAEFVEATVQVVIPAAQMRHWATSDEVSIESHQPLGGEGSLRILVEKDFRCAVPRPGEEDYDGFPNPNAGAC